MLAVSTLMAASASARQKLTIEEMKGQITNLKVGDRPPACIRISEEQLEAADRFYQAGDSQKGKAALIDVETFAELARDYAIQSHKHEKQSEIAVRKMVRKLGDIKRLVSIDDQADVQRTADGLQRVRDDLLAAMFPKAG